MADFKVFEVDLSKKRTKKKKKKWQWGQLEIEKKKKRKKKFRKFENEMKMTKERLKNMGKDQRKPMGNFFFMKRRNKPSGVREGEKRFLIHDLLLVILMANAEGNPKELSRGTLSTLHSTP